MATTKETVRCNVIQKNKKLAHLQSELQKEIPVENGLLQWQKANCALLIVMERYGKMAIFLFFFNGSTSFRERSHCDNLGP